MPIRRHDSEPKITERRFTERECERARGVNGSALINYLTRTRGIVLRRNEGLQRRVVGERDEDIARLDICRPRLASRSQQRSEERGHQCVSLPLPNAGSRAREGGRREGPLESHPGTFCPGMCPGARRGSCLGVGARGSGDCRRGR